MFANGLDLSAATAMAIFSTSIAAVATSLPSLVKDSSQYWCYCISGTAMAASIADNGDGCLDRFRILNVTFRPAIKKLF
jgi:hypothetical protein